MFFSRHDWGVGSYKTNSAMGTSRLTQPWGLQDYLSHGDFKTTSAIQNSIPIRKESLSALLSFIAVI
jgi:hypothetical protein